MVSLLLSILTLESVGTLIDMLGTVIGIGFQIADYFKKSGRRRRKPRRRKNRIK